MIHVVTATSLRDQHAAVTRTRLLSAVAEVLEEGDAEDLTMPDVAVAAGVSLRTVYRYYPTREELLEAAGRWIGDELLGQRYPQTLDEVAELFRVGCRDFDERPGLVRAMALSQLGRSMRAYRRRERLEAIGQALRDEVGNLPESEQQRAEAVLAYLHHMLAYTTLREESGLSGDEIGEALAWAIRTLVDDLRRRNGQTRRRESRK